MMMKELLSKFGVQQYDSWIYEYESVNLPWWDTEYPTNIEIEVHQSDDSFIQLTVVFCPETEGMVERTPVMMTAFANDELIHETLLATTVGDELLPDQNFGFSEEHQAYTIKTFEEALMALKAILDLITNPDPVFISSLNEEDEEDIEFEPGDTLDHFIAMMLMNDSPFTKEEIEDHIGIGVATDGEEYLTQLKADVNTDIDLDPDFEIDKQSLELVKEVVRGYEE